MDPTQIGRLVAAKRKELGLSQRELGDRLGVTDKTVSKWECGRGLPEVSLLLPLAEALGLSVGELLSGGETVRDEEVILELAQENQKSRADRRSLLLALALSLPLTVGLWLLCFANSNIWQIGHTPTPLTAFYLFSGAILIFLPVFFLLYGALRRQAALCLAALSGAAFCSLLFALVYRAPALALPAAGATVCSAGLSLWLLLRQKK